MTPFALFAAFAAIAAGQTGTAAQNSSTAGIQWFATIASGFAEAKRTGRPILLISAAPHCAGVSGIW